ncbi:hypothetical protein MTO96_005260 [Rhipicephalus appendiculatus]
MLHRLNCRPICHVRLGRSCVLALGEGEGVAAGEESVRSGRTPAAARQSTLSAWRSASTRSRLGVASPEASQRLADWRNRVSAPCNIRLSEDLRRPGIEAYEGALTGKGVLQRSIRLAT